MRQTELSGPLSGRRGKFLAATSGVIVLLLLFALGHNGSGGAAPLLG